MQKLPVDEHIPAIISLIGQSACTILHAPPGTGKTTRVPAALAKALAKGKVWVLEPRRLAAKLSAERVSTELGSPVGKFCGYQFRFENRADSSTRLLFMTEGVFQRKIAHDPRIEDVQALVLDEFHERSLQGDFALAYGLYLQRTRADLKMVIMSATLDIPPLQNALPNAAFYAIDARTFPVEIRYTARSTDPLEKRVASAVRVATTELRGRNSKTVLVFLPGMAEMRKCASLLEKEGLGRATCLLHGSLSRDEQENALHPSTDVKIVLSTNIAETSLTLPNIGAIVDSGLHRQASYSSWSGTSRLSTKTISRASAEQRTGRAGRTAEGLCIRLYSEGEFKNWNPVDTPEILRADIASLLLQLKALKLDPNELPWITPPTPGQWEQSAALLQRLDAINESEQLTSTGRAMLSLPLAPRLARALCQTPSHPMLALCVRISEGQLESMNLMDRRHLELDAGLAKVADLLSRQLQLTAANDQEVAQAFLAGFPDQVFQLRDKSQRDAALSGGGSVKFSRDFDVSSRYGIVVDGYEPEGASRMVQATCILPIDEELLVAHRSTSVVENLAWNPNLKRVERTERLSFGNLVLEESSRLAPPGPATAEVLFKNIIGTAVKSDSARELSTAYRLLLSEETFLHHAARLLLWVGKEAQKEAESRLAVRLKEPFLRAASFSDLSEVDWAELIDSDSDTSLFEMRKQLPLVVELPSGRKVPIHYELDSPPWIESRLQDFFGLEDTPRINRGRTPLTVRLLAPNKRPVQITQDLKSFWEHGYPEIRRELSRRYPRHAWPQNPRMKVKVNV